MTEVELLKLVLTYAPNAAIIIGIMKLYQKITSAFSQMQDQVNQNTDDIGKLIDIHIDRHEEDAKILLKRPKKV